MNAKTNRISAQLGFWAAVLSTVAFLVYTVSFAAILRTGPALVWTNLAEYVAAVRQTNQFWKHLAQLSMLLFAPLFLVLLHSIHELAPRPKQPLSRIAISFGLGFAVLFARPLLRAVERRAPGDRRRRRHWPGAIHNCPHP